MAGLARLLLQPTVTPFTGAPHWRPSPDYYPPLRSEDAHHKDALDDEKARRRTQGLRRNMSSAEDMFRRCRGWGGVR